MKKTALITGTSSGIGLYAAVALAQAGFDVVATLRNQAKAGALQQAATDAGVAVTVLPLDVQDDASVSNCVQQVLAQYGHIDLLVNNAGSGYLGSLEETPMADLQAVMDVNFYGVWRMTQAVLPAMRAAGSGRVISVTSIGGVIGQPFNDAYCAAKFAVEGMMESLAPVAKRMGVQVVMIEPGPVNTEFVASVQHKREAAGGGIAAYDGMRNAYLAGAAQAFQAIGQTGADVAQVIVQAACAENPHLRYTTSDIVRSIAARKLVDVTGDSVVALSGARLP